MPRANRHFLTGYIWHITHRCHGKEFLFNDQADRNCWLSLLRKARDRFGITVLGYCVTCNHIHLMLEDTGIIDAIPRSMQFMQGQFAQSYNRNTGRINAFWGDRYFATAIQSGIHLIRCLAYIDLNMVRAGIVTHPDQWRECGYKEIHNECTRDGIINKNRLAALLDCKDFQSLKKVHDQIIEETLQKEELIRDSRWTESLAVGSQVFTERFAERLGDRLKSRSVIQVNNEDVFMVREDTSSNYITVDHKTESTELSNEIRFDDIETVGYQDT
ncbi:MAG TPA: transposase [Chitinispirillaceae bacterium]|nr:transposase [Chitinispirillaceae bacterium]